MSTKKPVLNVEESNDLAEVIFGISEGAFMPSARQTESILAAVRLAISSSAPKVDAFREAGVVPRLRRVAKLAGCENALPKDDQAASGAMFSCLGIIANALANHTDRAAYEKVGREMVALTTTVHGPDEWPAIPTLWRMCMEDRDKAQAALCACRIDSPIREAAMAVCHNATVLRTAEGNPDPTTAAVPWEVVVRIREILFPSVPRADQR